MKPVTPEGTVYVAVTGRWLDERVDTEVTAVVATDPSALAV
jgi:hypothetical protein